MKAPRSAKLAASRGSRIRFDTEYVGPGMPLWLPKGGALIEELEKLTDALRPWTIDFHVAQNDGTTYGSGSHEKTGRHCLATDPKGKLNIARDSGYWLRDGLGRVTKKTKHICWDGCMFPNDVMMKQQTWNAILASMIQVRENHGWKA